MLFISQLVFCGGGSAFGERVRLINSKAELYVLFYSQQSFVRMGSELKEVVYATSGELLKLPYEGLAEGYYLVGSGNTGVAAGLATMGAIYATTVFASSLIIRRPPAGLLPAGYSPPASQAGAGASGFSSPTLRPCEARDNIKALLSKLNSCGILSDFFLHGSKSQLP